MFLSYHFLCLAHSHTFSLPHQHSDMREIILTTIKYIFLWNALMLQQQQLLSSSLASLLPFIKTAIFLRLRGKFFSDVRTKKVLRKNSARDHKKAGR